MKILVINGPNINMLGIREPEIYGSETYDDLIDMVWEAKGNDHDISFFQSNHEGDIVDAIQDAYEDGVEGIVINPAAYTHTSIAIADALKAVSIPAVEVHISDPDTREEYRKVSFIRDIVNATVKGEGLSGYIKAIDILEK
jgi:3-dehydroquinate dehydratase type II